VAGSRSRSFSQSGGVRSKYDSTDGSTRRDPARNDNRDQDEESIALASAAVLKKLERDLARATRGCRSQKPLSPSQLPASFQESSNPTIAIPTSAGQPSFEMGTSMSLGERSCFSLLLVPFFYHLPFTAAVVRHAQHLAFERLPVTLPRPRGRAGAALAAASFDAPQFISGTLKVKPGSMKDEESTFNCTQVFVVLMCHPRGLQVDINGQSYLMSPGDHFFVPQGEVDRT
jgi:hypothetical protein